MSDTEFSLPYSTEILERKGKGFETHDIFNYKPFAEFLQNLLDDTNEPKTVAIHGDWGSGKTVFVEMWKEHMEDKGFSVIYFDAFKHDYQSDVFLSLTRSLCTHFVDPGKEELMNKAKEIIKISSRNLVNRLSGGLIDEKLLNAISNLCEEDSCEEEKSLDDFKNILLRLIKEKENQKPFIFVVDELDRCRPDFALEILEKVKHVFSIKNLHFVFAVNLNSLENSVQKSYGVDKQYLQKFFKFSLALPQNIKELPFYEDNYFLKKPNSYIFYFFKKLENEGSFSVHSADVLIGVYRDIVSIKSRGNKSFTIRDFQRTHDYFLFGVRRLPTNEGLLAEDNKYYVLLQHYWLSLERRNLFNKLGEIVYSPKDSLRSAINAINEEEKEFLRKREFNNLASYGRNDNMKIYWDIIENMKYLLFSDSTSSSPDRN